MKDDSTRMRKERLFYLDFIRSIAVILILMTHHNANYIYMFSEEAMKKVIITTRICNIYIGDFGVALFLIISGASLMHTYGEKIDLKKYYVKRFLGIYPMFWIAYLVVFVYFIIKNGGISQQIPFWKIIYSILGIDGYIACVTPTFYYIGEWFLGFIILVYLIFPLLRFGMNKKPVILVSIVMALYFYFMLTYHYDFTKNIFFFIRLPEIVFGMFFVKYIKKVRWPLGIAGLAILLLNAFLKPNIDQSFQMTYVGIAAFLFLTWCSCIFERIEAIRWIFDGLSKYSYSIFLTHHIIMYELLAFTDLNRFTVGMSYLGFLIVCCVVACCSKILYLVNEKLVSFLKRIYCYPISGNNYTK